MLSRIIGFMLLAIPTFVLLAISTFPGIGSMLKLYEITCVYPIIGFTTLTVVCIVIGACLLLKED